jgi:hypothetical protein
MSALPFCTIESAILVQPFLPIRTGDTRIHALSLCLLQAPLHQGAPVAQALVFRVHSQEFKYHDSTPGPDQSGLMEA